MDGFIYFDFELENIVKETFQDPKGWRGLEYKYIKGLGIRFYYDENREESKERDDRENIIIEKKPLKESISLPERIPVFEEAEKEKEWLEQF